MDIDADMEKYELDLATSRARARTAKAELVATIEQLKLTTAEWDLSDQARDVLNLSLNQLLKSAQGLGD